MWKRTLRFIAVVFVVMQCYRPARNVSATPSLEDDFLVRHEAPAEVRQLFAAACYDCHSNVTRYPWYAEIQPFGWWLADHVADGKAELNFSEFGAYSARTQGNLIDEMIDETEGRSMPLKSYLITHHDAKLSDDQIAMLVEWLEEQHDKIE